MSGLHLSMPHHNTIQSAYDWTLHWVGPDVNTNHPKEKAKNTGKK